MLSIMLSIFFLSYAMRTRDEISEELYNQQKLLALFQQRVSRDQHLFYVKTGGCGIVISGSLKLLLGYLGFGTQPADLGLVTSAVAEVSSLFTMPDEVQGLESVSYQECLVQVKLLSAAIEKLNKEYDSFDEESDGFCQPAAPECNNLRRRVVISRECD